MSAFCVLDDPAKSGDEVRLLRAVCWLRMGELELAKDSFEEDRQLCVAALDHEADSQADITKFGRLWSIHLSGEDEERPKLDKQRLILSRKDSENLVKGRFRLEDELALQRKK